MPFVSNIGILMEKKKMTYEELQFLSKVAPDTIARAKDVRIATVKLLTLEKLAVALDADVRELFEHVRGK
jgi:DNA-binding Xre family transcriptional regulator